MTQVTRIRQPARLNSMLVGRYNLGTNSLYYRPDTPLVNIDTTSSLGYRPSDYPVSPFGKPAVVPVTKHAGRWSNVALPTVVIYTNWYTRLPIAALLVRYPPLRHHDS